LENQSLWAAAIWGTWFSLTPISREVLVLSKIWQIGENAVFFDTQVRKALQSQKSKWFMNRCEWMQSPMSSCPWWHPLAHFHSNLDVQHASWCPYVSLSSWHP
jgi:hypothetical protein